MRAEGVVNRSAIGLVASTAAIRFITSLLQAVAPLYLVLLGLRSIVASYVIVILWVSIASGSVIATAIGSAFMTSIAGLLVASGGLALFLSFRAAAALGIAVAGLGAGIAGSALAPSLHVLSSEDRPFEGIGAYSLGLSIGLICALLSSSLASPRYLWIVFAAASIVSLATAVIIALRPPPRHANLKVRIPGPSDLFRFFSDRGFARVFYINLTYSLAFPLVLSYWSIYAVDVLRLSTSTAFGAMAAMFTISMAIRAAALRARNVLPLEWASILSFIVSSAMLSSGVTLVSILGIMLFSVPHALIYPTTLYESLRQRPGEEVKASYLMSISSGAGEILAPMAATLIILSGGLPHIYEATVVLSVAALAGFLII